MKFAYSLASNIRAYVPITKLLSMSPLNHCGKFRITDWYSIVMEYADYGDLFQKITRHQKEQSYFKEEEVWSIFI